MKKYFEEMLRKQYEQLEEEAKIFMLMGYELKELTIVCHPNGDQEVAPLSAINND